MCNIGISNIISKFTWIWHLKNTFTFLIIYLIIPTKKLLVVILQIKNRGGGGAKLIPMVYILHASSGIIILCGHPNERFISQTFTQRWLDRPNICETLLCFFQNSQACRKHYCDTEIYVLFKIISIKYLIIHYVIFGYFMSQNLEGFSLKLVFSVD